MDVCLHVCDIYMCVTFACGLFRMLHVLSVVTRESCGHLHNVMCNCCPHAALSTVIQEMKSEVSEVLTIFLNTFQNTRKSIIFYSSQ